MFHSLYTLTVITIFNFNINNYDLYFNINKIMFCVHKGKFK